MLREQIDALDAALIQLVAERARVSRRIQTARMNAGGTRVELGRERTVLNSLPRRARRRRPDPRRRRAAGVSRRALIPASTRQSSRTCRIV